MYKRMAVYCLFLVIFSVGCGRTIHFGPDKEKVEYVICKESNLPAQLQELLEEKKKKSCTFTFTNSMYTYLVVCYGSRPYSGYSVRIEECSKTPEALYLRTQLIGPSAREPVVETETFPFLVLRCEKVDVLCIIDS